MPMHKSIRQVAAWIACLAILLAALAPSISHALNGSGRVGEGWLEICSATSAGKVMQVADAQNPIAPASADHAKHLAHCPFCSSHLGAVDLPASLDLALRILDPTPAYPALFYQSPRPLFLWAAAQSRAPPCIS
jgi:hypothetical protein